MTLARQPIDVSGCEFELDPDTTYQSLVSLTSNNANTAASHPTSSPHATLVGEICIRSEDNLNA
jgi:hypothetical protein